MNPYYFNISLRIWHPTFDPDDITKSLKISPKRKWRAGERRSTPKGNLLEGYNKETYWSAAIHSEEYLYSKEVTLEKYLMDFSQSIQNQLAFFREIRDAGGRVEYFIGLYINSNSGSVMSTSLLALLGDLGIDLSLDLYPELKSE